MAGVTGLILTVPVYGLLHWQFEGIAFLNRMAITFGLIIIVMTLLTVCKPLSQPKVISARTDIDMADSFTVKILGGVLIAVTIALYIIFR